jgi:hypothetical protein
LFIGLAELATTAVHSVIGALKFGFENNKEFSHATAGIHCDRFIGGNAVGDKSRRFR